MNRKLVRVGLVIELLVLSSVITPRPARALSPSVVISQVYGGGGNSGATFRQDFIELFNRGTTTVSLAGWSVQYASSIGITWQATPLNGSIAPGRYYLIRQAAGAGGTIDVPPPDAAGGTAMSATAGKVALVSSTVSLSGGCPTSNPAVVDFVGYGSANCFEGAGAAPTLTNTTAAFRRDNGNMETDNNAADFVSGAPNPRNSGTTPVTLVPIHGIQGPGSASPIAGQVVLTAGIVTALKSNGFFIQTPDSEADSDPNTSQGIFVFTSGAPPAAAARANRVNVLGTVLEFGGLTEIGNAPTVTLVSTSVPLPAQVAITAANTDPAGNTEQLEKYEGMRIRVDSLTAVSGTLGSIDDATATASSNGVFYAVISGMGRTYREPGIPTTAALPPGAPCCVPRFDTNPERLRVDSDAQPGSTAIDLNTGAMVLNVSGVLDYGFNTYTIDPDATPAPTVVAAPPLASIPQPDATEITVGSLNLHRLYDTIDDTGTSDVAVNPGALANRLNKISLAIRESMQMPDVVGVQEAENLSVLENLAAKLNNDETAASRPNPQYRAYLEEGNDLSGIDVGFLVKTTRVNVINVTQEGKATTFVHPVTAALVLLHDRPPLVLHASAQGAPFTVIVNHLRSLSDVEDAGNSGTFARHKRRAQAEFLANLIQARQAANPSEKIISAGDYNAFQFNDGYVDSLGTIQGDPTPLSEVVLPSGDLVNPDLTVLTDMMASDQYSYIFDGNSQALDHIVVNSNAMSVLKRFAYARGNADVAEINRNDPNSPLRISDHDMPVAYFAIPDTVAPVIESLRANPASLWPPNSKLVDVTIAVRVSDDRDSAPVCKIESITSNETLDAGDWQIIQGQVSGSGVLRMKLKSERSGSSKDGRIYTTTIRCTDAAGNSSTSTVKVTAPHDNSGKVK